MSQTYTAVIKQGGAWWIGWIEQVPGIDCQEQTREQLPETLRGPDDQSARGSGISASMAV